jgi:hypothetical protein
MDYYTNQNNDRDRMPQEHSCLIHVVHRTDNGGMYQTRQPIAKNPDLAAKARRVAHFRETALRRRHTRLEAAVEKSAARLDVGHAPAYGWLGKACIAKAEAALKEKQRLAATHPVVRVLLAWIEVICWLWDYWLDHGMTPPGFGRICEEIHAGFHAASKELQRSPLPA